jgi:Fe-S-cluster containining protein
LRQAAEHRRAVAHGHGGPTGLPCALLAEDRCTVYPVRPLTCRGFNSSDARKCEQSLGGGQRVVVPSYAPQQRLAVFILDGLRAGLEQSGLDGELLELSAALHCALTVRDALSRWLAGDPLFASARMR